MLDTPRASLVAALKERLGARASTADAMLEQHARDEAHHRPMRPDAVVFPESTAEVAEIVRAAAAAGCPIIPFGAGSSLEGHVQAVRGGLCLDMSRMHQVLATHAEDLDAVVQPGVTRKQLNAHLRDTGLMFTVDPGADATLGGMAATRASGTNTVRYGGMRENVLALEVVLADGRVIRTGTRARKSAAGYDLTRLFVGSEGTLGVITELTVRLFGRPEATAAATCAFPSIAAAVDAVILTLQCGLQVARIELVDAVQIRGVNAYSNMSLPEAPHLFLEFDGTEAGVAEQSARFGELAAGFGAEGFAWATREEERSRLWAARHSAYYAARALRPGAEGFVTDVCVPISRLAQCIAETEADLARTALMAPLVGHVGDGNFHLSILVKPDDPAEMAEAGALAERLAERALALEGTVTGEHGVGIGKRKYMPAEHGEAYQVMGALKRALDPGDLMNPGKVVDVG
ncbi:MAG: FAD-linked oxidase C-terminal domain-containing protein [Pseudomonadota bacterium]